MRRLFTPLLLALSSFALASCDQQPLRAASDLVLLYTGNVNGFIEPCGCVAGQIGGIDRISGYIEREMDLLGDRGLFIDTGDLFAEGVVADSNSQEQLEVKAEQFLKVWKHLGCDALALGEAEVGVGVDVVKRLANAADLPILAGNIIDWDGNRPFRESVIFERGGLKIGVFSLLGGTMAQPIPKKGKKRLKRNDVVALLEDQGYTLESWRARAEQLVSELRPQVDLLFCASHLGYNRNVQLAELQPKIDMIFGGHYGASESQTSEVSGMPILTTRLRGSRVGRFEVWLDEPEQYLAKHNGGQHGLLANDGMYEENLITMEVSRQVYGELAGMERKYGTVKWERKREVQQQTYDLSFENLKAIQANPSGNRFSNNQVPMHHGIPRSDFALNAVDDYHAGTHELWEQRNAGKEPKPHGSHIFAGAEACITCHQEQYNFWRGTRHSRAFATLQATDQETDAECIGCHTIGYQTKGGFNLPGQSDGFENVQCAACHGGAADHMAGGASFVIPNLVSKGMSGCARCHKDEHDPFFESQGASKLLMVACPKIGSNGVKAQAITDAYLESAAALRQMPKKNWALIGKAYARAGETGKAVSVARFDVRENNGSMSTRLLLAERLLDDNQAKLASEQYRIVTSNVPDDARGWTGLAWSLFESDRAESLIAARESYALDPDAVMGARIFAMGLMGTGKLDEARKALKRHIALHPNQEQSLIDLLSQLPQPTAESVK